uniref:Putative WRKY transcription factor 16 n=1 Tax=Aegilops tauschii TaxID=37682 RepID=N1QRX4_AEGTA
MQRTIAEELNLRHVMHIFDKEDEGDDFSGVDNSSRKAIPRIASLINKSLRDERFLMIFHNGGGEGIDMVECGIPLYGEGKLLCTYGGRFLGDEWKEFKLMHTSANINIYLAAYSTYIAAPLIENVLHKEAAAVIGDTGLDGINTETVLDCFLYTLFLTTRLPENFTGVDYGWATHACNYWICDGILGEDKTWEIGNTLYHVIPLLGNSTFETRLLDGQKKPYVGWYSVTSNKLRADDISNVPGSASSYFLTFQGDDDPVYVRNDLFQLASNNLRVLKLYNCSFNFASPPFQCCHNLRFLWLDHCANTGKKQSGGPSFLNLLVLDIRFTDYVFLPQMIELMTNLRELNTKGVSWKTASHAWKKLQKLQKLRLTESSDVVTVDSCSSVDMMNLELLDLSGNTHLESLPTLSSARSLKTLILDGCSSLEQVALQGAPPLLESFSFDGYGPAENWTHSIHLPQKELRLKSPLAPVEIVKQVALQGAPPLLESFSFDGYGPAENWTHSIHLPQKELRLKSPLAPVEIVKVTKISLHGCGRLHNIFLRALPNLEELDLSGTAIKIIDLNAMDVPKLKKLFLLGCERLRSLIWKGYSPRLEVLHVDTQGTKRSVVCCGEQGSFHFQAHIVFTDGRFIWSFSEGLNSRSQNVVPKVYLLISCTSRSQANITKSIKEIGSSRQGLFPTRPLLPYNDIAMAKDVTCSLLVWNCQQLQTLNVHIEIGKGSYNLESMQDEEDFRSLAEDVVESLHVHDNCSITAIPPTDWSYWRRLKWCHVERCPKLHSVFPSRERTYSFRHINIFSASDLLVAYCIWGGIQKTWDDPYHTHQSLQQLQHIYLYNCPRLVFVLPISFTLPNLETLQIAYCSNLRHVFPWDHETEQIASGFTFDNLKHIKLHHLHKLEQICEVKLTAPALQTIGLRDCWGLRRLPAVARQGPKPVVDCEKDLWDKLKWDGLRAGHHPSLFETRHSTYYKKTLPRGSYLRFVAH